MKPKVIIALNTSWNLVNFRGGLISALVHEGYEVVAVAPVDDYSPRLLALGCRYVPIPMDNKGTHPGKDFLLFLRFVLLMYKERPDVFLGYTVKPNIYGTLAAHLLKIPVINNISGLGSVFITKSWRTRLVRTLYRLALRRSHKVFFQNNEDKDLFVSSKLVPETISDRLPGSGINLNKFKPSTLPTNAPIRFLLIARMLKDKGIYEYVEAARLLKYQGIDAEFCLLGFLDVKNPTAISQAEMDVWVFDGVVRYLGVSDNVQEEIKQATCVVLPSYREGTSRTLLEAAAMARPIVTTDAVGCRDVVEDGINGYLCRTKDADDLAEKMIRIALLTAQEREEMGLRGREKVEREFDEEVVIEKYFEAISSILY